MAFRDDLLQVLSGGLPALLDGSQQPIQAQVLPVEAIPPEPQLQDREPFLGFANIKQNTVLGIGAGIVLLIGVLAFARR